MLQRLERKVVQGQPGSDVTRAAGHTSSRHQCEIRMARDPHNGPVGTTVDSPAINLVVAIRQLGRDEILCRLSLTPCRRMAYQSDQKFQFVFEDRIDGIDGRPIQNSNPKPLSILSLAL
ncbi:hypothetical protein [Sinorhizobium meliloti]|uniref:hypothetical protein n=2 Tax=Rhizobium meliloti TaxID=382 RepID=UPI00237F4DCA|nr:hypothetical protein [Sinorhizobium meliloti]